jgi:hypothetical protein
MLKRYFLSGSSLEHQEVARSMPDQIDIERQRHQFPAVIGELPQVLEQLLGVRASPSVPDRSQMSMAYSIVGTASSFWAMPYLRWFPRVGSATRRRRRAEGPTLAGPKS